ncbi:DUF695 domain-containing protein [Sodaliphilus sp.]|uniref:DUF695 domain-containing protein n=1 Tax=Sodaliphilus sp. TaxID=2815818 RepID=UPI00388E2471
MAKIKIPNDWWTAPAEAENGQLILVTGRRGMQVVKETGFYKHRIEVTWAYEPDDKGMPDFATSKLMEEVNDAFEAAFGKDPVAVVTGIYTGAGERNWVFYTRSLHIFQRKLNEALAELPVLPLSFYAEEDPDWEEYSQMCETEIADTDDE